MVRCVETGQDATVIRFPTWHSAPAGPDIGAERTLAVAGNQIQTATELWNRENNQ